MGRKKKKPVKPWCWYCNREFDDDKILIQHQRAKHFKCPMCHKKLYSGPGLTVHCIQVHKEKLDKIPEALPNRNSVDIDIYGIQGIPEEDLREHERLKRGDEGSKSQSSNDKQQQNKNTPQQPQPMIQNVAALTAMHAAMYQHAMGLSPMPPGFPMPPGMPGTAMLQPGYSAMPPGMHMPPPHPGMGFPPGFMPPNLSGPLPPHMGFAPPPPPPSTSEGSLLPTTSGVVPPPPPMSGVGHLIGIPPPKYNPPSQLTQKIDHKSSREDVNKDERSYQRHSDRVDLKKQETSASVTTSVSQQQTSSATFISKPPSTKSATTVSSFKPEAKISKFIEISSANARIMHPSEDISLEELKLSHSRYKDMLNRSSEASVNN